MITKVRSCKIFLKYRISGFRGGIKPRDPDILLYKTEDVDNHLYKDLYEKAVDLLVKTKLELEQIKMENA